MLSTGIFNEAKQILDKDGKVNPLGPYGKQKLTGREVATYFRRHKVTDPQVKKAIEVALDMGGAMDIAGKEIQKFFGKAIRDNKDVKSALQYANESYITAKESIVEHSIVYAVKGIAKPEREKFQQAAKYYKSSITYSTGKGGYDLVTISNKNKKQLRDMDAIVRGKSSYGDPTTSEKRGGSHFEESHAIKIDEGKFTKYSDLLMKKAKLVAQGPIAAKEVAAVNKQISAEMKKLGVKEDTVTEAIVEAKASVLDQVLAVADSKSAKKINGTMVDMFTASVIRQVYDKVNDTNKARMEKSNLDTLVGLAHKMMG